MAYTPPAYAGINFAQFSSWPTKEVNNQLFYQVPNNPGFYYDPRRNHVFSDNYLNQAAQQQALQQQQAQIAEAQANQTLHPPGLAQQLLPVFAAGAAQYGGQQLGQGHLPFGIGNLFGGGSGPPAAASPVTPTAASSIAQAPGGSPFSGIGNWISSLWGGGGGAASGASAGIPATPDVISGSLVGGDGAAATPGGFGFVDALPYAGAALGAYELYQGFKHKNTAQAALGGAGAGAGIGFEVGGPIGAGVGAGIGGLVGLGSSLQGGKSKDERARSLTRDNLAASGIADRSAKLGGNLTADQVKGDEGGTFVPLSDGTWYNISKDKSGGTKEYNVADTSKPFSSQAVEWANPIAFLAAGKDHTQAQQLASQLTNAITSNADDPETMRKNALAIFDRMHLTQQQATQAIDQGISGKLYSPQEGAVFKQGLQTLFAPDPTKYDQLSFDERQKALTSGTPEPVIAAKTTSKTPIGALPVNGQPMQSISPLKINPFSAGA